MGTTDHKKILIVEDEQDILQLVKHYLEKEGFRTDQRHERDLKL